MEKLNAFLKKSNKKILQASNFVGKLKVTVASDVGKLREGNEDNFYCEHIGVRKSGNSSFKLELPLDNRKVFAVCDGMGGEMFGEDASQMVVDCVEDYISAFKKSYSRGLSEVVERCINEANCKICNMMSEKHCKNSGSTLALLFIDSRNVRFFTIGDSRIYRFSEGKLTQLSEDQTLAVKKIKAHIYTQEEAVNSPDAHRLTSYIGSDIRGVGLKPLSYNKISTDKSVFMLCSDGLTDMCSDEEIKAVLNGSNENTAVALVEKALENGGRDNVTCIVIEIAKD